MKGNAGQDHSRDTRHAVRLARDGHEIAALKRASSSTKTARASPTRQRRLRNASRTFPNSIRQERGASPHGILNPVNRRTMLVTSALPYANGAPHIGHVV